MIWMSFDKDTRAFEKNVEMLKAPPAAMSDANKVPLMIEAKVLMKDSAFGSILEKPGNSIEAFVFAKIFPDELRISLGSDISACIYDFGMVSWNSNSIVIILFSVSKLVSTVYSSFSSLLSPIQTFQNFRFFALTFMLSLIILSSKSDRK